MYEHGYRFRPRFCLFPGYNYCGPGCSGPGNPLNAVDAACKQHDECYRYYGDYCMCDRAFLHRLKQLQNPYTQEGRHARMMYKYMKLQQIFTCGF